MLLRPRWIAVLLTFAFVATASAADKKPKETKDKKTAVSGKVELTGTVAVEKDDKDKITAVTLAADDGKTYIVDLNKKGKKLGETMDGKTVQAKGTVKSKKDKEGNETFLLKVSDYEEKEAGAENEAADDEDGGDL